MVFSTEDLVLTKVPSSLKRLRQLINNHTTLNVHESVLSWKLAFWMSNWKHAILTLNFHEFLYAMYNYVLNSVVKIPLMFARYFEYYGIILRGAFFRGHAVYPYIQLTSIQNDNLYDVLHNTTLVCKNRILKGEPNSRIISLLFSTCGMEY